MSNQKSVSKTDQNIEVNTLEEAEQQIYRLVKSGKNFRDIVKSTFLINDTLKRFSLSQISNIKNKFELKINESNRDAEKALVFKLFKQGKSPTEVLIKTGLSYDYIKKAREEYLEFQKAIKLREHTRYL